MRMLTTEKERRVTMEYPKKAASKIVKILFPITVTLVTCLIAPMGTPLMGMIMLGNLMEESGVVARLTKASKNEIANIVTLFRGLYIGGTMEGAKFLNPQTLLVLGLGFLAICLDTGYRGAFRQTHVLCHKRQGQSADRRGRHIRVSNGRKGCADGRH